MLFGKLVNFLHLSLPLSLSSNALGIYNSLMPILVVYSIFSLTTAAASVTAILCLTPLAHRILSKLKYSCLLRHRPINFLSWAEAAGLFTTRGETGRFEPFFPSFFGLKVYLIILKEQNLSPRPMREGFIRFSDLHF